MSWGKPRLRLWGEALTLAEKLGVAHMHVTLADERHYTPALRSFWKVRFAGWQRKRYLTYRPIYCRPDKHPTPSGIVALEVR